MLSRLKILSFTHWLQGPSATQFLSDVGADVIKIEPPRGAWERQWSGCDVYSNGVSVFFLLANRNQRAVAIDLKAEEGRKIIHDLVREYDIVIENFKPGVMDKLGLGYESLKKINPRVIFCSCTGYGATGPMAEVPGQDLLAQSFSGLTSLSGPGDRPPAPVGTSVVDQHGAALAAFGILAAAYGRESSGKGCKVDCSLLNAAMDIQLEPFAYFMNSGWKHPERATTGLSSRIHPSPYGVYRTADGYISLSLNPFDKLEAVFSPGALANFKSGDQKAARLEFDKVVAGEIAKRTTSEWMDLFQKHGIWYSKVNDYADVLAEEQVKINQVVMEMDHPVAGKVKVLNHPNRYDGQAPRLRRLPPELGEHTAAVLGELGYDGEKIRTLMDKGVVAGKKA